MAGIVQPAAGADTAGPMGGRPLWSAGGVGVGYPSPPGAPLRGDPGDAGSRGVASVINKMFNELFSSSIRRQGLPLKKEK